MLGNCARCYHDRFFYLMDCKPVICYVDTSVSCYAIIYNGYGDSDIQRGRYGGLNYALCLETMPRQRLTIYPNDRELSANSVSYTGIASRQLCM